MEERILHMCESISHPSLQGRYPAPLQHQAQPTQQGTRTAVHLTLLRLLLIWDITKKSERQIRSFFHETAE